MLIVNELGTASKSLCEKNLTDEEFINELYDKVYNDPPYTDADSDALNKMLSESVKGYTPPTRKEIEERTKITEKARESFNNYLLHCHKNIKDYEFGAGEARWLESVLKPVHTPGDNNDVWNDQMAKILKGGTPEELHSVIGIIGNELSSVDPDKILQESDKELAGSLEGLYHTFILANEASNLVNHLEKKGLKVTEQERKFIKDLEQTVQSCYSTTAGRISMMLDSCYAKVDMSQLKVDALGGERLSTLTDGVPTSRSRYLDAKGTQFAAFKMQTDELIHSLLQDDPTLKDKPVEEYYLSYSAKPGAAESTVIGGEGYTDANEYMMDLAKGETVYIHENGENGRVIPIRDFIGNGTVTIVPPEVDEPGILTKLVHSVMKAFGSDGIKACRDFEEYSSTMKSLEKSAKAAQKSLFPGFKETKKKYNTYMDDYNKVIDKINDIEKNIRQENTKVDEYPRLMEEMMGPEADGGELLKTRRFTREVYDPKPMKLPDDCPFSDREFALIACACVSEEKLIPQIKGKQIEGISREEKLDLFFTSSFTDTFLTKRPQFGQMITHYQAARENAVKYIEEYQKGNKAPLAEALGNMFTLTGESMLGRETPATEDKALVDIQNNLYDFMSKDPDLLKLSGISERAMDAYRSCKVRIQAHERGEEAEKKLLESIRDNAPLPDEEKKECLRRVLLERGMVHFDVMSHNVILKGDKVAKLMQENAVDATADAKKRTEIDMAEKSKAAPEVIEKLKAEDKVINSRMNAFTARVGHALAEKQLSPTRIEIAKMNNPEKGLEFVESYIERTPAFQELMKGDTGALRSYLTGKNETISRKVYGETNDIIESEKKAEEMAKEVQVQKENVKANANPQMQQRI